MKCRHEMCPPRSVETRRMARRAIPIQRARKRSPFNDFEGDCARIPVTVALDRRDRPAIGLAQFRSIR